jgi:hypothetical protein
VAALGTPIGDLAVVNWTTPVFTNAYGVVTGGMFTGVWTNPGNVPMHITEDQYFRPM